MVDSLITSSPLPKWFRREIEPGGAEPWNPCSASSAGSGGAAQLVEALFDVSKCGSGASLDATRTRVEFTGMATVIFTEAIPPEGLHTMEFDVLGRDQCLLGVATPDVDVETYLGHKRGGYGFFASEGTLKVDGDWKGGHGLCKFKRGDKVGIHVDMSRRTLQFSVSHWEADADTGHGRWQQTLLERIVEGIPSVLHFAVGGAAGGEISIAGGSASASVGEERLASYDMLLDGGYDNVNWPEEMDSQLVIFLNEKSSEKRKHPRNIRSTDLVAADGEFTLVEPDSRRDGMETGESADESVSSSRDRSPFRRRDRAESPDTHRHSPRGPGPSLSGFDSSDSEHWMGWAAPVRGGADGGSIGGMVEVDPSVASDYVVYQRRRGTSFGGARSATSVRARFVVLKKLESLVAATLPLVDLRSNRETDSAAGRLVSIKGRLFEATKMHMWDAAIR